MGEQIQKVKRTKEEFFGQFKEIFIKNGLENYTTDAIIEKFYELTELMLKTNRVMNVTALTTWEKIIPLHHADCVKIAPYIPDHASVADIGCGGGFPVLPLAIVRPDLTFTAVDSTEKKVRYVQETADKLGLGNRITTIAARAEDLSKVALEKHGKNGKNKEVKSANYREVFDVVISRAVARLEILDELCMPLVKTGGLFIAMKGAAGSEELDAARNGIERLGGVVSKEETYPIELQNESETRTLIVIQKEKATPVEFPRTFGNIKKKPL